MTSPWEFERLCSMGGAMLRGAPADVDFDALLWAIGGAESSFGRNNVPHPSEGAVGAGAPDRLNYLASPRPAWPSPAMPSRAKPR